MNNVTKRLTENGHNGITACILQEGLGRRYHLSDGGRRIFEHGDALSDAVK
jgi:hypothetical protein